MGRTAEGIWGVTWIRERRVSRWLEENALLIACLGKVGSTESIAQLSEGVVLNRMLKCGWTKVREAEKREGAALFGVGRVREDVMSWKRIWRDEFPLQGPSASFQTSLSPLCYSVRTHSSASPPKSKTQDTSEKPVGNGMCGMHILAALHMGVNSTRLF